MRTEVIKADSIDEAVERILDELKEDDATTARSISSRNNVIYFDGWDGLGASAVLRAVAQRLTMASSEAPAGLQFDQIIQIDCSKWESRRALQRVIAEQLKLPAQVMEMFDRQDAEDDYNGLAMESRAEIPQIAREMYGHVTKVLLIFHNGGDEEIDMSSFCGFPLSGYSTNKVLWTFQGRFRMCPRIKVDRAFKQGAATDVFLSAVTERDPQVQSSYLVLQEAADLVAAVGAGKSNNGHGLVGSVGIMPIQLPQGQSDIGSNEDDDAPRRAADALQREMQLDVEYWRHNLESLPSRLVRCGDRIASMPYWISPPYEALLSPLGVGDMFQQFDKLGVLKLSRCTFSFLSPPFHSCNNLRVLWLDHCKDQEISLDGAPEKTEEDTRRLFQRLWVLDLCYSCCDRILSAQMIALMTQLRELNVVGAHDWDIGQLQGRLPNIRRLRVTKSKVRCSGHSEQDLFQGMNSMELLDFSGNHTMNSITEISTSNNCLETIIITDGCIGLQKSSLRGCVKLKNLLFSGLFEDLRILDLSGTAVKTLDLTAITARRLHELILDNCDKLCAILWPPEDKRKRNLQKLHIDTTCSAAALIPMNEKSIEDITAANIMTLSSASLSVVHGGKAISEFDWCIGVRDARLLRSLDPFKHYFKDNTLAHVEIYSLASTAFSSGNDNKAASSNSSIKQQHVPLVKVDKPTDSFVYADVEVTLKDHPLLQPSEGDAPMLTQIWPCPSIPSHSALTCYTHIQDHELSTKSLSGGEQTMTSIIIPEMICRNAFILHVHDSLSITSIPGPAPALGSTWYFLRWCRVERCPKLEHVFTAPELQARGDVVVFNWLQTFWTSELSKVHYIWNWNPPSVFQFQEQSFVVLELLHMDLCPRVIHVLPLALQMAKRSLGQLKTLEIMWCGDLREVFPLYTEDAKNEQQQQQSATTIVHFQRLKRIHLHELPKLQGICGRWRISAPMLKTVKIRGCWSLKRLPAISNNTSKKVECDCEKEWWDTLEWDGLDANHHPSLYKATHSQYYKKTQLKGSVLR